MDGPAHRGGDDGRIATVFMASCPGAKEQAAGRPLAGASGRNLEAALPHLQSRFGADLFPSLRLDDYTLTNAWPRIEHPAATGRSEATAAEVMAPDNLAAAARRIGDPFCLVALGERAAVLGRALRPRRLVSGRHPSPLSLNIRFRSERATPALRTDDRLSQWVAAMEDSAGA